MTKRGLNWGVQMFADKEFEMSVQACAEYVGRSGDGGSGDGRGPRVLVVGEELPQFLGNALGYVRVSGTGQEIDGTSLETQAEALQKRAVEIRYALPEDQIIPDVIPGDTTVRPGIMRVMHLLKTGKYHLLLVYDPDRLARDAVVLMNLLEQVSATGVPIEFLHGAPGDALEAKSVMCVLGYAAQRERMQIAERAMRGKRATALMGRMPVGVGGAGIYGYHYDAAVKGRTASDGKLWRRGRCSSGSRADARNMETRRN